MPSQTKRLVSTLINDRVLPKDETFFSSHDARQIHTALKLDFKCNKFMEYMTNEANTR